jgi:hypothetical protein
MSNIFPATDRPNTFADIVDAVSRENGLQDGLGDVLDGQRLELKHQVNRGDGTYEHYDITVEPACNGKPALFTMESGAYRS